LTITIYGDTGKELTNFDEFRSGFEMIISGVCINKIGIQRVVQNNKIAGFVGYIIWFIFDKGTIPKIPGICSVISTGKSELFSDRIPECRVVDLEIFKVVFSPNSLFAIINHGVFNSDVGIAAGTPDAKCDFR